jgi:Tol biopolymer transport system component
MPHGDAAFRQLVCSAFAALVSAFLYTSAIPADRTSDNQSSPTVQFVYYKVVNIPLAMDAPSRKDIYSVSTKNVEEKQLTTGGHSFNPVLSPDGTRIAYIHVTADTCEDCLVPPRYEINVMNADGTEPRTLVSIDKPVLLTWSPDGRTLLYGGAVPVIRQPYAGLPDSDTISEMAGLESSAYPLYQISSDGDAPARLVAENVTGFFNKLEWSPDGKWMAYSCRGPQEVGKRRFRICLLGTGQQAETRVLTESADFFQPYSWSPDGAQIVYSAFDQEANKLRKDSYRVFVVRTDGSAPRLLTTTKNGVTTPQWSHDGDTIIFCDWEKDKSSIGIIHADGTGKIRLTDPKLNASNPMWSADGKEIAFTASVHGKLQAHLMNADGSQLRALTRDSKLACSNITWVGNTRLLLLRCGQAVAPLGPRFGTSINGGYYLLSTADPIGAPRPLAQQGAIAISFALDAESSAPLAR